MPRTSGPSLPDSSTRTPTRSQKSKRSVIDHDITPRSSPRKKRTSPLKPSQPSILQREDEQSLQTLESPPNRDRPSLQLEQDIDPSSSEEEAEGDGDLMAQLENTEQSQRGFLKSNNPEDAYFIAHSKIMPTSANLFSSRPNWEPFTISTYLDALDDPFTFEETTLNKNRESYTKRWSQWRTELEQGFSLMFYGLGTKRVALNEFLEEALVKVLGWEGLVVNGFQAGSQVTDVLGGLEGIVDEQEGETGEPTVTSGRMNSFEVLDARTRRLCTGLASVKTPICILIHNLDGRGFRHVRSQSILSMIAAQPNVHLIASMDHLYAPVLIPSTLASGRPDTSNTRHADDAGGVYGYNFLYHHLATHLPYTLETIMDGTLSNLFPPTIFPPTVIAPNASKSDVRQNGPTTVKAINHVLSSLTSKAKSLFRLLAEHQIETYQTLSSSQQSKLDQRFQKDSSSQDETPTIAMSSRSLFEIARTEFVASVQSQMSALLIEFRDHGIILGRHEPPADRDEPERERIGMGDGDDDEWLWIGLGKDELSEVVANMDHI